MQNDIYANVLLGLFYLNFKKTKQNGILKVQEQTIDWKCTIGNSIVDVVGAKHLMTSLPDGLQLTTVSFAPSWRWSTVSNSWRPAQRQTSTWKT